MKINIRLGFPFLSLLVIMMLVFSCKNPRTTEIILPNLQVLNTKNLEYFKIEEPLIYIYIPEYKYLLKIDSLVNKIIQQYEINIIDSSTINEFVNVSNQYMGKGNEFLTYEHLYKIIIERDRLKLENELFLSEYICGNELIKQYNYYLFRMPVSKVHVVPKSNIISLGETYNAEILLSCYKPNKKFIAIVDNDTLSYNNLKLVYSLKPNTKGNIRKVGKFYIYNEGTQEYDGRDFEINFLVK